jgi:tRNA(adenine34) deaminase
MDEKYMNIALEEAYKSYEKGDVPVGAVVVYKNEIIARAHNCKEQNKNAVEHAEILAISQACQKLNTWHLEECTIYVTLEPCLMCAGALIQSRIGKLVFATENEKFGYVGSISNVLNNKSNNHHPIIINGICKEKSQKLLKEFFKDKRN